MLATRRAVRLSISFCLGLTLLLSSPGCGTREDPTENPLAAGAATSPFVGTFVGDTLTAEFALDTDGKTLTGTITHKDATYPATARQRDDRITGTFTTGGNELAFTATLEEKTLTLESGGATHVMTRRVEVPPANPLVAEKPAAPPETEEKPMTPKEHDAPPKPPADAVVLTRLEMDTYKHATGFTFEHPRGWQVQQSQGGLAMVPPDARKDDKGQPLEFFLLGSDDATGISDPADPNVLQYLDQQIKQMFPSFQRVGEVVKVRTLLGDGIALNYEGRTSTNLDGKAGVYATLYRSYGIFLLHLGEKELVDKREDTARRIFSSFGWTKGQIDNNLVGTWKREAIASTSSGAEGGLSSNTTMTWAFGSDGTAAFGSATAIFGHVSGPGGQVTIDPRQRGKVWKGVWSVNQNQLTVQYDTGRVEVYEYKVFAHIDNQTALKLVTPGEKKPEYYIKQ